MIITFIAVFGFESSRVYSQRLAAFVIPAKLVLAKAGSGNPKKAAGFRVTPGMTTDTPLHVAG